MLEIVRAGQFRRDVKRMERRHKDLAKLRTVILALIERRPLAQSFSDHPLKGDWKGFRDVHIEPDWLLIYRIDGDTLLLARTGSHADLFAK